ncbi:MULTISPECIES: RNA polymerase sigma-70 factor [Parabacteroides]|jgi:RNA polymerase sigma-70 factor|uniref:RNA polymerase sigma-70 factor n=1 Tax=Parabacteroides TaxID=375288 RepID=UPI000EFFDB7E|nr:MULTISPECIES: RNA polymerase sigma-70 factor [Parabacteroides]MBC8617579.1 RNA polymerase sigma-70 factor [Parabacteroides faecis]RHR40192.1 RNA polymerase sigma-70 factor [Parabacteroides sp. AF18-52]RHR99547.1 RNA polymerase sigma-70 factor [Parabacteroides sp. AF14-59]GGJ87749.1 DNA-directed RNA polymerase sigma-70 factor [Parabacteroides faecis]
MQVENTDILLKDVRNNFDKIYVMYYSRMFRFAKEYVLFDEDAENIVQDVFLLLWEKREVLDIQISLVSYLFALVKNKSLDYLRRKVIADEYKEELSAKLASLESLNYSFTSDEEIEQILMTAIDKLPERCRQVFLKSRIEGKKNREIADELDLSMSTVENQMTIALRKLRIELKDYLPLLLFLLDVK